MVEGPFAGHHDAEAVAAVGSLDQAEELVDVRPPLDAEQDGVVVAGDLENP